ncbi:MAG: DEAD/DEAH box helicase family protein [Alkalibacterium sp.]|nr:DEAD/DEAH box helicase family protein [Alkalibacterium sp.]
MSDHTLLYGRELILREIFSSYSEDVIKQCSKRPAFTVEKGKYTCNRCQTVSRLKKGYPCRCGERCYYCRECIQLGKVRACDELISLAEPNQFQTLTIPALKWEGVLSDQQKEASLAIHESMNRNEKRIIWAVTGAGKTEMLFYGMGKALEKGKRICLASPRIDVCLELAPRLHSAFPEVSSLLLYGGSEVDYSYTQLLVTTTHQLLRFKEAFDVIIIDEIDAFPFHLNAALHFAAEKAGKNVCSVIYLTATPDKSMQRKIKYGEIKSSILPARYHKHPLPVPKGVRMKASLLEESFEQSAVIRHLNTLLAQKKKFLLFVPTISLMESLVPLFEQYFKCSRFEWVHSKDPCRKEKVTDMREQKLDFLMTTTILERGVTFEHIDVIVVDADHEVYTEAALVQIAGRVGRSAAYPDGEVTFYSRTWTRPIKRAIKQITDMNKLGIEKGLII